MPSNRYLVVEGPPGVGKASLAERLAAHFQSRLVLEQTEDNPFWGGLKVDPHRYGFQAQLFFLTSRFKQQQELSQLNLFYRGVVSDYLFDRDRIYAQLHLGDEEFGLYDQIFTLLADRLSPPDLVIYLSMQSDALWRRNRKRFEAEGIFKDDLARLNEAYHRFFFSYEQAPLLAVNATGVDLLEDQKEFEHLAREAVRHKKGVKHYIPMKEAWLFG